MDCWERDTPIPWQVECSELLVERPCGTLPYLCDFKLKQVSNSWAFANFLYLLRKSFYFGSNPSLCGTAKGIDISIIFLVARRILIAGLV